MEPEITLEESPPPPPPPPPPLLPQPRPHQEDDQTDLSLLLAELVFLQSKSSTLEETIFTLQQERDEAFDRISHLETVAHETSRERDSIRERINEVEVSCKGKEEEFSRRVEDESLKREELEKEVNFFKESVERLELEVNEIRGRNGFLLKALESLNPVKDCLVKIIEGLDGDEEKIVVERSGNEEGTEDTLKGIEDEEMRMIWKELVSIRSLASEAECKVWGFKEVKEKENKELESSVVSLTEENRDINSLLRVALVEKEAMEKKLKGGNSEQKRVALLQIAERGLRGVGFGFMIGGGSVEQSAESAGAGSVTSTAAPSSTTGSVKSEGSECEEEVVSLASTVEKIMKNLRLEITQLRRSLEESRSDNERLQSLTDKQAQEIGGNRLYIKELEDRERLLTQNIEELLTEIKETEAEVARWREACELEVEAGKSEVGERDKVVSILRQELEKTKAALDISNGKLKLKEELADAAMAAQAAAEKSLQLVDSRATELRERIEVLTKQLEEAESRERNRHKLRHICWPWRTSKVNPANKANTAFRTSRLLPEMQALLQYSV